MPRSTRAAPASAAAPEPAPKKRASARLSGASSSAPKKQKYNASTPNTSVKSTTKKSKYFQKGRPKGSKTNANTSSEREEDFISDDEADPDADWESPEPASSEHSDHEPESLTREDSEYSESESKRIRVSGRKNGKPSKGKTQANTSQSSINKELWREGVKTGLGPGKEVLISKSKARDPGNIPYKDDNLHPNTLLFLKDLAKNNEREWLKRHDPDYRASKKDWDTFVESLTEKIAEQDSTIPELPAKDLVFRIHRDIRFSKDPTPYKTHFSAAWSRTGKKGPYAAYYVHCQPGACFVGSGLWHPEADKLALLRQDIDQNSHRLKAILREEGIRREIFGGISDDEKEVTQAFFNHNSENALKTRPKGYEYDNENIQLLRLRSFTIGKPLSDQELLSSSAQEKIATLIGIMEPFVTYLNSVVMPDQVDQDTSVASDSSDENEN